MAFLPSNLEMNTDTVVALEPSDYVTAENSNKYYRQLLSNDKRIIEKNNLRDRVVRVKLLASRWNMSGSQWTQTVNADATGAALPFVSTDKPDLISQLPENADATSQKSYNKAYGILQGGVGSVGNGTATFKVWKVPSIDIIVGLKGV